jgi:cytochrome c-type biogenesis protein CcmE
MFLALREIRRSKARFVLATGALTLLVMLVVGLQAMLGGLLTQFVGAIEHQSGEVVVFGDDARVLVVKGLSDATVYFRNADEAIAQREELGTRRFRLQGTVVAEPDRTGNHVTFDVAYGGASVPVRHTGDPPDLFRPGIPVVLEGRWANEADVFESDRILVKHDETYESRDDYDDRMGQTEQREPRAAPN